MSAPSKSLPKVSTRSADAAERKRRISAGLSARKAPPVTVAAEPEAPPATSARWSDADREALRKLWVEDRCSAKEAAQKMSAIRGVSVTRNAVLGQLSRLGLAGAGGTLAGKAEAPPDAPKPAPVVAAEGPVRPSEPVETPSAPKAPADELTGPAVLVDEDAEATVESSTPKRGRWRLSELRPGFSQCRYPCTPDHVRPEDHRFCGEPVAWWDGKPKSYCPEHMEVVTVAPRRGAGGGESLANLIAKRETAA